MEFSIAAASQAIRRGGENLIPHLEAAIARIKELEAGATAPTYSAPAPSVPAPAPPRPARSARRRRG